jgi:LCP family protein required for cell wall assembly
MAGTARKRWLKRILLALAAAVVVVAGLGAAYAFSLAQSFDSSTETIENVFPDETLRPPVPVQGAEKGEGEPEERKAQNILLLGSDTRGNVGDSLEGAGGRADTMLVLHIPADRENLQLMSIMRDSWVDIPAHGQAKVNAALAYGGVPLMVQTVESLIGSRIDHVAIVDFEGFRGLTDALGGVKIDNPLAFDPLHLRGHTFPKGPQQLNGDEALAFVRERYAFRDGDYQRVRNQQLFLKAVMAKTLSAETLTNPLRISGFVNAIAPYLTVDPGLDSGYVAGLALELRDVRSDDITMFTMPTLGTGTEGTQSVVRVDWDELEEVREHFAEGTLDEYETRFETVG